MKTFIISLCILFISSTASFAQSSCSKFYPFTEGATSELTMYGKNGKVAAIVQYTVTNVSNSGDSTTATMTQELKDDKKTTLTSTTYDIVCADGVVSMDYRSMSRPEMMSQLPEDIETEITGTNLDIPNDLSVGDNLPDAGINIKVDFSGIKMNMNTNITNRKVIGKESVTTPAGNFDCYVITQTTEMKMGMGGNRKNNSKHWIAEGVGMVKMEDYNKKGKVMNSGVLTAFSK
ncbi:MAG: hypothetical protein KJO23_07250 [Bacteroidia bacterium]|nr:hypothetical protein [Bacteroidia bacterium]NNM24282.1 hypothetical protein [Flavobacteriaceae bacterium]